MRKKLIGKAVTANSSDKFVNIDIPTNYYDIIQRSINHSRAKKSVDEIITTTIQKLLKKHY